ncbi:hypothetical protein H8959_014649 [Pygathrix nigripes]
MFPEMTQKDFQLSGGSPPEVVQVSHQEHDACQDLPKCKPPENKDIMQSPQTPPRLKEHELAEESRDASQDNDKPGNCQPKDKCSRDLNPVRAAGEG